MKANKIEKEEKNIILVSAELKIFIEVEINVKFEYYNLLPTKLCSKIKKAAGI